MLGRRILVAKRITHELHLIKTLNLSTEFVQLTPNERAAYSRPMRASLGNGIGSRHIAASQGFEFGEKKNFARRAYTIHTTFSIDDAHNVPAQSSITRPHQIEQTEQSISPSYHKHSTNVSHTHTHPKGENSNSRTRDDLNRNKIKLNL